MIREQYVTADCLSCIINRDISLEELPEPFRMQSNVSFRVTYSEYTRFVLDLPNNTSVILSESCATLRNLASTGSIALYNKFLEDMAFGICKELWYAEHYKRDASVILPAHESTAEMTIEQLLKVYDAMSGVWNELILKVQDAGYEKFRIAREHNKRLFKVAVMLYYLSLLPPGIDEVNLVYA